MEASNAISQNSLPTASGRNRVPNSRSEIRRFQGDARNSTEGNEIRIRPLLMNQEGGLSEKQFHSLVSLSVPQIRLVERHE